MTDGREGLVGPIPVRGGSSGVPRTSPLEIQGKSLVARCVRTPLASSLQWVLVSSDCHEILRRAGARLLKGVRSVRDHPAWVLQPRGGLLAPGLDSPSPHRPDLPALSILFGAIYINGPEFIGEPDPLAPAAWLEIPWPESVDVEEPADLEPARRLAAAVAADEPARDRAV